MQLRLLLDANISWRSVGALRKVFDDCRHVDDIGLTVPAKDTEIWNFALQEGMIIVTNDDDFMHLSATKGFPPKVVLLRTGNQSRQFIEQMLLSQKENIALFANAAEYGILEII
ncbi:MAG: DUF5615 family PIN-like protein [Tannerella sp.]|jgi:predicted nuclease of predicted toxin-antitoxin system|nr:DUF5615 family PIN-like protein [Tannerella sp.]